MAQIFSKFSSVNRSKTIIGKILSVLGQLFNMCYLGAQEVVFWRGSDCRVPCLRREIAKLEEANFHTLGGCLSADGFAVLVTKARGDDDLPFVVRIYILSKLGDRSAKEEFIEITSFQIDANLFWVRLDRDRLVGCLLQSYQHGLSGPKLYTVFYELEFDDLREAIGILGSSLELNGERLRMLSENVRSKIKLTVLEDCSAALYPGGKFMVFSKSGTFLV